MVITLIYRKSLVITILQIIIVEKKFLYKFNHAIIIIMMMKELCFKDNKTKREKKITEKNH